MPKSFLSYYKLPLLISATLAILVIAIRLESRPAAIFAIFLGALIGTFLLEVDALLQLLFFESESTTSCEFRELWKDRNWEGAFLFFETHKNGGRSLFKSAIFQVILAALSLYICATSQNPFAPTLVLSSLLGSFYYQFSEYQEKGTIDSWFWVLKEAPGKSFYVGYFIAMGLVVLYSLSAIA